MSSKKILVIKISALGDVIRSTGFLKSYKEKNPDDEIYFFTSNYYAEILKLCPNIKQVFSYPRYLFTQIIIAEDKKLEEKINIIFQFISHIRKIGFDRIYDFTNTFESSIIATILSNYNSDIIEGFYIEKDYSYKTNSFIRLYNNYFFEKNFPAPLLHNQLLKLAADKNIKNCKASIVVSEDLKYNVKLQLKELGLDLTQKIISIQPSAAKASKRWDNTELIKFIQYLNSRYENPVLLLGNELEKEYINSIIQNNLKAINIALYNDLCEIKSTAAIISISDFLLTMDTFAMHLASELNIPFLSLQFAFLTLPCGSSNSVIFFNSKIKSDDVIKIYNHYFENIIENEIQTFDGELYVYDERMFNKYAPELKLSVNKIFNYITGTIFTLSFFDVFDIKTDINSDDIIYYMKKYGIQSNEVKLSIKNLVDEIKSDLMKYNEMLVKNDFSEFEYFKSKKYFFADLFLLHNVLSEKISANFILNSQLKFLYKTIEYFTNLIYQNGQN